MSRKVVCDTGKGLLSSSEAKKNLQLLINANRINQAVYDAIIVKL